MKKLLRISLITSFLVIGAPLSARSFQTPLNYYNNWIRPDLGIPGYCSKDCETDFSNCDENNCIIMPIVSGYYRTMSKAFDSCSSTTKHDLSYLFHGSDSFTIANLFENNTIPTTFPGAAALGIVKVNPQYSFEERGAIFGVDFERDYDICGRKFVATLQVRVPVKDLVITNVGGSAAALSIAASSQTTSSSSSSSTTGSNLFSTDIESGPFGPGGSNVSYSAFAARLDYLVDQGLIAPVSKTPTSYFAVNKNIRVISATGTPSASSQSMKFGGNINTGGILIGDVLKNTTTTNAFNNTITAAALSTTVGGSITTVSGTNTGTFTVTLNGTAGIPQDTTAIVPVELFDQVNTANGVNPGSTLSVSSVDLSSYPVIQVNGITTGPVYYTNLNGGLMQSSTTATNPTNDDTLSTNGPLPTGFNAAFVAYNTGSVTSSQASGNVPTMNGVIYKTPPVVVQQAVSGGLPTQFGQQLLLAKSVAQGNTGLYNNVTYNPGQTDTTGYGISNTNTGTAFYTPGSGAIVGPDGTFRTTANPASTEAPANTPGFFWYQENYANLLTQTTTPLQNLYITTSLDSNGTPTPESQALLTELLALQTQQNSSSISTLSTANATTTAAQFFSGSFAGGVNALTGVPLNPTVPPINWNEFSKKGVGDIDVTLTFGGCRAACGLLGDLIVGVVIPTASVISPCCNYLAMPLGNNGHFELKAGGQFAWDMSSTLRFTGSGVYSWALSARESIIAPFTGATVYGLQPVCTSADISWQQVVACADISFFPTSCCGLDVGYQYMFKRHDKITLCSKTATDGVGTLNQALSAALPQQLSERQAHKIKAAVFGMLSPTCTLSLGWSDIVAGKNIGQETDWYLTLAMDF